jgi:hypothetical protein
MATTQNDPTTVFLGGPKTVVASLAASAAITPGHLIERFNSSGVVRLRKSATAGANVPRIVALDQPTQNKGVDDAYAANDLVEAVVAAPGTSLWMLIGSGENIAAGGKLESAGNGKLRALASGTPLFTALENKDNSAGSTDVRIRVEAF